MTTTPPHSRPDVDRNGADRPGAPAWYDTAAAPVGPDAPTTRHPAVTPGTVGTVARRTVSARVAAVIGIVAFLLGAGLAMLTGPLLGGGPGGPGGPGGAPGTSQQSGTTTSSTTGT